MKSSAVKNLNEIARVNPKVDVDKLRELLVELKKLRDMGIRESEYDLVPPFSRRLFYSEE